MLSETEIGIKLSRMGPLSMHEAEELMVSIAQPEISTETRYEFLAMLRERGETTGELSGFASGIRKLSPLTRIPGTTDIVGTGADGKRTINVSTAAAIVCSSLGLKIAKHGNRAVTGIFGSADFLEKNGYQFDFSQREAENRILRVNFLFVLANLHNPAFGRFREARKRIRGETVFNLLGPITNPCDPDRSVIGCNAPNKMSVYERVLHRLGKEGVIVCSEDGIDEVSPSAPTRVSFVNGGIFSKTIDPMEEFGMKFDIDEVTGTTPEEIYSKTMSSLSGDNEKGASFIAMNASPAFLISNAAGSLGEGYNIALKCIKTKRALALLKRVGSLGNDSEIGEIHD